MAKRKNSNKENIYRRNEGLDELRIPITRARNNISDIVGRVKESYDPYYITKRGKVEAILVNEELWNNMNSRLKETYKKTFINPKFDDHVSEFTDEEIEEWMEEDKLQ
jgi:prevent-host-death family protein